MATFDPLQIVKGIQRAKKDGLSEKEIKEALAYKAREMSSAAPAEPEKRGFVKQSGDFIAGLGTGATKGIISGVGNLAKVSDVINPVSYLAKAYEQPTFGEDSKKITNYALEGVKTLDRESRVSPESRSSFGGRLGEGLGEVAGNIGVQVPALVSGGGVLSAAGKAPAAIKASKLAPKLATAIGFGAKSAGGTTVALGATEGRLPSKKELSVYGLVDLLAGRIAKGGRNIYQGAFKAPKQQEANIIKNYDTTLGEIAQKLGYKGTAKSISSQADLAANKIWKNLVREADQIKPVSRTEFIQKVTPKLTKEFDALPASEVKTGIFSRIKEVVKQNAPTKAATGKEIVELVKNINRSLFDDGARTVLSPKQVKSLTNNLKVSVKELLPASVKSKYKDYAMNRVISNVMKDNQVQRLVMRTTLGGTAAGSAAFGAGVTSDQDISKIITNTIIATLAGAAGARATGSVGLKTYGGAALSGIAKPAAQAMKSNIIEALKKALSGEEELDN